MHCPLVYGVQNTSHIPQGLKQIKLSWCNGDSPQPPWEPAQDPAFEQRCSSLQRVLESSPMVASSTLILFFLIFPKHIGELYVDAIAQTEHLL